MLEFGPYQLVQRLATGGMGEVYLARLRREEGFEKVMVIKRILPHLAEDPEFRDMFLNEARLAAALSHTNVAQVFDFGQIDGIYYLAMEYVHGTQVRSLIRRCQERRQRLAVEHAVQIVLGCCHGLEHAHKRLGTDGTAMPVIHRDVSPRNILLSFEGEVKLCDFGLARVASKDVTNPGLLKGKYSYMSPEHVRGEALDGRSDLFSLGTVFYELLTGRQAFPLGKGVRDTLGKVAQGVYSPIHPSLEVPEGLRDVVSRCLKPNPADRYPDARSMASALQEASTALVGEVSSFGVADLVRDLFAEEAATPLLADNPVTAVASRPIHSTSGEQKESGDKRTSPNTPAALRQKPEASYESGQVPEELRTTISALQAPPLPEGWSVSAWWGALSILVLLGGAWLWGAFGQGPQRVASEGQPATTTEATPQAQRTTAPAVEEKPGGSPWGAAPPGGTVRDEASQEEAVESSPTPGESPPAREKKPGKKRAKKPLVPARAATQPPLVAPDPAGKEEHSVRAAPPSVRPLGPGAVAEADKAPSAKGDKELISPEAERIWVKVVSKSGEEFVWDGRTVQGSARRAFEPGRGSVLRFGQAGWQQTLRLETSRAGPPHRLQLNASSQPFAELVLDGSSLGTTPVTGVQLSAGMHRVAFSSRDGERRELILGAP